MILSQPDLREAVEKGEIVFDPSLEESQWGEASIDIRLGFSFTRLKAIPGIRISVAEGLLGLAEGGFWDTMILEQFDAFGKRRTFPLAPQEFVLAMTYETIKVPGNLVALIEGRSTYARVGLSMHQTAPWIQKGWSGRIVLEMMNNGPLTIELTPFIDRPCQLTFLQLTKPLPKEMAYGSRDTDIYRDQQHPLKHRKVSSRRPRKS